jgi:hypothetical protein
MAIFEHERKNGIQMGTVGDECMQCKVKHKADEEYEPESLDYKPVYKIWIHNIPRCLCLDCFKESLGQYVLVDPNELEEEKPKSNNKKNNKKKEDDKDGSETA